MQVTLLNDLLLEESKHGLMEFIESITLEIVHQRDTEFFLPGAFDDLQEWTDSLALCGLQVVEEVALN